MGLDKIIGSCLVSQEIRDQITIKKIITEFNESRIQPSSYDVVIGDEVFVLDTEVNGVFRPQLSETIRQTLLQLPGRQRQKYNISSGFEIKKGFTYLFPLADKIILDENEYIKSSPKSSFGRLFLNTRLIADYNPCFDEISSNYKINSPLDLWLLVQPLTFNLIVYPGLSLNQLKLFRGFDAQLSPSEINEEYKKNPLLYHKENDLLVAAKPMITDGLQIHLDLSGQFTEGVIGLKARHNPTAIDLKSIGSYQAEHFFEPLLRQNGHVKILSGEHYLFASNEILSIPNHLNVELKSHSHIGLNGPLHFAGFIDNGFTGDLVFEVRSDELSSMGLVDGMPISKLEVFRTNIPDKIYGKSIGSTYQEQVGPRPSKFFKPFDFNYAARNYKKLSREVLVQDAKLLLADRNKKEGFEYCLDVSTLFDNVNSGFFQSRYDCEFDEELLQPIPYVLIFRKSDNSICSYVRASDIKDYGDERLFGKHSIGFGGHIAAEDGPDFINSCLTREVNEEVEIIGGHSAPYLLGTLMQYDTPVDRVHFGLVFGMTIEGDIALKEKSAISAKMVPIDELIADGGYSKKYETWSKILIPELRNFNLLLKDQKK